MSSGKMQIRSASVTSMKVGTNGFEVTLQEGLLHKPNGEVVLVKFGIERGAQAYPVGDYEFSLDSLHTDRYGRLELKPNITLVAVKAQQLSKAS
jgi:hypothetical protein